MKRSYTGNMKKDFGRLCQNDEIFLHVIDEYMAYISRYCLPYALEKFRSDLIQTESAILFRNFCLKEATLVGCMFEIDRDAPENIQTGEQVWLRIVNKFKTRIKVTDVNLREVAEI